MRLCVHQDLHEVHKNLGGADVGDRGPFGFVSRLAVHPDGRGLGVGATLGLERTRLAETLGARSSPCQSSLSRAGRKDAPEAQGFRPFSAEPDSFPFPGGSILWLVRRLFA